MTERPFSMLSFSLVAEALAGLIYHRPSGENFSFLLRAGWGRRGILILTLTRADVGFELSLISQSEQIC